MDHVEILERDGGVVVAGAYGAGEWDSLNSYIARLLVDDGVRERGGAVYACRNVLELCPSLVTAWRTAPLIDLLHRVLGSNAGLVRGLYFDKPPEQTWALPWHKDLTIAVREDREVPGYSKPRLKAGVWHCEPPLTVLEAMLTLRIHLDKVTEENGPLEVLPGSQGTGKELRVGRFEPLRILAGAGDVFVMRPLLAHCSGRSHVGTRRHRRVLHLEFASIRQLPGGHRWHAFYPIAIPPAAGRES